jgi:hypothetical protein
MKKPQAKAPEIELPEWVKILERDFGQELVRFALMDVYKTRVLDMVRRTTDDMSLRDFTDLVTKVRGTKQ